MFLEPLLTALLLLAEATLLELLVAVGLLVLCLFELLLMLLVLFLLVEELLVLLEAPLVEELLRLVDVPLRVLLVLLELFEEPLLIVDEEFRAGEVLLVLAPLLDVEEFEFITPVLRREDVVPFLKFELLLRTGLFTVLLPYLVFLLNRSYLLLYRLSP